MGLILAERHPEWFAAYVGVGQVTQKDRERAIADKFLLAEATRRNRSDALAELKASPNDAREKWLFEFGAELHGQTSFVPLVLAGLLAPEYSLSDTLNTVKGPQYASKHLQYDVGPISITELVKKVQVPVFIVAGRFDYNTPTELARSYLDGLVAPCKKFFTFEHSAHFPFFEEPEQFLATLREIRDLPCVAERISRAQQEALRPPDHQPTLVAALPPYGRAGSTEGEPRRMPASSPLMQAESYLLRL